MRVEQAFIHVVVDNLRAMFDLVARNLDCGCLIAREDQLFELGAASDISALTDIDEAGRILGHIIFSYSRDEGLSHNDIIVKGPADVEFPIGNFCKAVLVVKSLCTGVPCIDAKEQPSITRCCIDHSVHQSAAQPATMKTGKAVNTFQFDITYFTCRQVGLANQGKANGGITGLNFG